MPPRKNKQQQHHPIYKYLQLIDGTELVSIVHNEEEGSTIIRLEDPLKIINMTPFLENSSDGSHTIMLTTWIPFTDDLSVSLNRDKILVITSASEKLVRHYKKVSAMIIELDIKDELNMMNRTELPDFENEIQKEEEVSSGNPLQDLVDTLKTAIEVKKKNIIFH